MIREDNPKQPPLPGFENPFECQLDTNNRWVKLAQIIPWSALSEHYHKTLSQSQGRPATQSRIVIGALIIKHKQGLSDAETVQQLRENPYLQYFVGLRAYTQERVFSPTLFVEIRKRMGQAVFDGFYQ